MKSTSKKPAKTPKTKAKSGAVSLPAAGQDRDQALAASKDALALAAANYDACARRPGGAAYAVTLAEVGDTFVAQDALLLQSIGLLRCAIEHPDVAHEDIEAALSVLVDARLTLDACVRDELVRAGVLASAAKAAES
jgi:hypothetical protein